MRTVLPPVPPFQGLSLALFATQGGADAGVTAASALPWAMLSLPLRGVRTDD